MEVNKELTSGRKPQKNIGMLWEKTSKKGYKYLSGFINIDNVEVRITLFKNDYKKKRDDGREDCDYKILVSDAVKAYVSPGIATVSKQETIRQTVYEQPSDIDF